MNNTYADHFTILYQACRQDLSMSDKQIADYLGVKKVAFWYKKNGQTVRKLDVLSLCALLVMKRVKGYVKYRELFWEIADVK